VIACSKAAEPAASRTQPQPAADAPTGGPSGAAEAAKPVESAKIEITDDLVLGYMEYQKENLALIRQYAEESSKNLESAKGDTAKMVKQFALNDKMGKELEEKRKAKRQSLGLGDAEFEAVKDAAQMVATGRALYNQMGGEAALAKILDEQKAEIAKMPAEQRAAAEAQVADMTKSFKDVRDGIDVRKKYGDRSAEVLLKYADALAKQYWEGLQMMGEKK